jgi:hypothetical protein
MHITLVSIKFLKFKKKIQFSQSTEYLKSDIQNFGYQLR